MIFRRISLILSIVVGALLATGCHDEYFNRLEQLENQVDTLQAICNRMNDNIYAIQRISSTLQSYDMITKVTKLYADDATTVIGYKISFKTSSPITIYDGIQGRVPVIGSKYDSAEGKFYWTIQYNGEAVQYMTDASGNRIPANGSIMPLFKVSEGEWYVSYDKGSSFTKLGQATGEDADAMFKSIIVYTDYVEIKLANGTVFNIPTEAAYKKYEEESEKVNQNLNALGSLTSVLKNKLYLYLTNIEDVKDSDGLVKGKKISLSDGSSFTINNATNVGIPSITIVEDTSDHIYYWAVQYEGEERQWLLTPDGQRVVVSGTGDNYPMVGTAIDTLNNSLNKGSFVWTMTVNDSTDYMKDPLGRTILSVAKNALFASVVDMGTYVEIKMADSTVYKINKRYSVAVDSTVISMAVSDTVTIRYNVCGVEFETVELMTQNGFKATADTASNTLKFISPASFDSNTSQVVAFFRFKQDESFTKIVSIPFDFIKKEEEEK